ncbi:MAG: hypothetical protein GWP05_03885 [Anaerolineaceae bacterium]|nr:hypothetical protein [Anaerolineaceae bacterium]
MAGRAAGPWGGGRCLDLVIEIDNHPAIRMVVAGHSRCGAALWASLHQGQDAAMSSSMQPATPWLATRLLPGALASPPDDMAMLADLQECVAWVWLGGAEKKERPE